MRRPILNHEAAQVYDPFLGSGTTMMAAELTGRRCFGLEIEQAYCDVIVTRWQNLTGKQATLDGDGRTFAEISASRKESAT
jgi:DNA modification methylase